MRLFPAFKLAQLPSGLRHLELEVVALGAEVFARFMHAMAIRALQLILIVRGHVRILRLHVLRLLNELLRRVALRALLDVRGIKFSRVALAVAHLAVHAASDMAIGAELLSSTGFAGQEERSAEAEH